MSKNQKKIRRNRGTRGHIVEVHGILKLKEKMTGYRVPPQ